MAQVAPYPVYDPVEHETTLKLQANRGIRWGAYGDPGILPGGSLSYFNNLASHHTGYTHHGGTPWCQQHKGTFQASTDRLLEQHEAIELDGKHSRSSAKSLTCPCMQSNVLLLWSIVKPNVLLASYAMVLGITSLSMLMVLLPTWLHSATLSV